MEEVARPQASYSSNAIRQPHIPVGYGPFDELMPSNYPLGYMPALTCARIEDCMGSAKVYSSHQSFVPWSLKQTSPGFHKLANRSSIYSQNAHDPVRKGVDAFARLHNCEHVAWLYLLDGGRLAPVYPSSPKSVLLRFLNDSFDDLRGLLEKASLRIPAFWQRKEAASSVATSKTAAINSLMMFPHSQDGFGQTVLILASRRHEIARSADCVAQANLLLDLMVHAEQERRSAEMVRSSTYVAELLLSSVPFPMAMLESSGRFLSVNAHFQNALGYSQQEFDAMQYNDLTAWHPGAALHKKGSYRSAGGPQDQMLTRKDGSTLLANVVVTTMEGLGSRQLIALKTMSGPERGERELEQRKREIRVLTAQLLRSQEDERKRLSRELHDDIGQRLSLVTSQIALLSDDPLQPLPGTYSGQLKHIRDELDTLCTDLHEMSHNLHSCKLQHLGLGPAIKAMCRDFERPAFHVDLHIDEFADPVAEDIALCIYRVAQEALNNALHHANAEKVCVIVTRLGATYYMSIQDTGSGFDTGVAKTGLGLISMTERVKLLNGEFRIHSLKGRGTEIWASIPDGSHTKTDFGRMV
ncbi:ATP-binding protein [Terriglobus sp. RCC_193]|uniref:sensor histidine kinase n=1 Tax=Terriglobus sp. RCC_193 TaxID=3239218 RepID=UPI0035266262